MAGKAIFNSRDCLAPGLLFIIVIQDVWTFELSNVPCSSNEDCVKSHKAAVFNLGTTCRAYPTLSVCMCQVTYAAFYYKCRKLSVDADAQISDFRCNVKNPAETCNADTFLDTSECAVVDGQPFCKCRKPYYYDWRAKDCVSAEDATPYTNRICRIPGKDCPHSDWKGSFTGLKSDACGEVSSNRTCVCKEAYVSIDGLCRPPQLKACALQASAFLICLSLLTGFLTSCV